MARTDILNINGVYSYGIWYPNLNKKAAHTEINMKTMSDIIKNTNLFLDVFLNKSII